MVLFLLGQDKCYEGGSLDAYILGIGYNIRGCPQHLPMFPLIKRNNEYNHSSYVRYRDLNIANIIGYLTSTLRIIGVAVGDWEESSYHRSRYENRDNKQYMHIVFLTSIRLNTFVVVYKGLVICNIPKLVEF